MSQSTVALPWARALLELAIDRKELTQVRRWLDELASLTQQSSDLRIVFSNPTITVAERKAVAGELAGRLGWSTMFQNYVSLVADRRRLGYLSAIAREFRKLADAHEGILRATARTATPLDDAQVMQLGVVLRSLTGRKVEVEQALDPSLIGGLQVFIDGRVYDTSVRSQLDGLRQSIQKELH